MAEDTYELDATSGSFTDITGTASKLAANAGATYGTSSPAPYSGAGRLEVPNTGYGGVLINQVSGGWITGATTPARFVDFFAWFPASFTGIHHLAGGYYYGTSGMAINASGNFGFANAAAAFTPASGSYSVPIGEWVRFAWKTSRNGDATYGEFRMFKGANLLGTTPDSSVPESGYASDGLAFIGGCGSWGQPGSFFIDSVWVNDTTWPTRGAAPSFNPSVAGQHNF
jgi:hypothetical protein